jgi:hypothetical protein
MNNHAPIIGDLTPEVEEQVNLATQAAQKLVRSGAFGNPEERDFIVSLSGHANPGHAPAPGYANDCVTINVTQKVVEVPQEAPPAEATKFDKRRKAQGEEIEEKDLPPELQK